MNLYEYWKTRPQGLWEEEVLDRREKLGANIIEKENKKGFLWHLTKELKNPLNVILLLAAIGSYFIATAEEGHIDTYVILAAVFINIFISIFQSRKTDETFEKLSSSKTDDVLVLRHEQKEIIHAKELVVGDVVILQSGVKVQADMILVSSKKLKLNEASLTGESSPVEKSHIVKSLQKGEEEEDPDVNKVFSGTFVSAGTGKAIVIAVGSETEFGKILSSLNDIEKRVSPMEEKMKKITFLISIIAIIATIVVVIAGIISGKTAAEIILLGVAIGVSAIPEGIGAAISASLSVGAYRILKNGGLVKDLVSAETLASVDTLLTDKTGTLTEGVMTLKELFSDKLSSRDVKIFAALSSEAFWDARNERFAGDEMDVAIAKSLKKDGLDFGSINYSNKVLDTLPFESKNKFFASLRQNMKSTDNEKIIYVKGAPEKILEACSKIQTSKGVKDFDIMEKYKFFEIFKRQQSADARFLALAYKKTNMLTLSENPKKILDDLVFVSLVSFSDPIKENAKEVVSEIKEMGTDVIMVTGDSREIAYDIALKTGIVHGQENDKGSIKVITGDRMEKMSEEELFEATKKTKVFARVSPSDKLKLANAMIGGGRTIAMTGDGVNDVLALSKADIGISFKNATEAAQETASLVLIDNDFRIITKSIGEGRNIIENIKKTVVYLLSSSFTGIIVITGAIFIGGPLPFLTVHILWINIIEEGLMNFSFIFGKNKNLKKENGKKYSSKILTKNIKKIIFTFGIFDAATTLGLYYYLTTLNISDIKLQSIMFLAMSLDFFFIAFALQNLRKPIWKSKIFSNIYFNIATTIGIILLSVTVFTEKGRSILHLEKFSQDEIIYLLLFALFDLILIEFIKWFIFWGKAKGNNKENKKMINKPVDSKVLDKKMMNDLKNKKQKNNKL